MVLDGTLAYAEIRSDILAGTASEPLHSENRKATPQTVVPTQLLLVSDASLEVDEGVRTASPGWNNPVQLPGGARPFIKKV